MDSQLSQRVINHLAAQRNREANDVALARAECDELAERLRVAQAKAEGLQATLDKTFAVLAAAVEGDGVIPADWPDTLTEFAQWRAAKAQTAEAADGT